MLIAEYAITRVGTAGAAVFDRWRHRAETAAIKRCDGAIQIRSALGVHIYDAGRAVAVLGGQRSGDQRHGVEKSCRELLPEAGKSIGKKQSIDPILQIRFFAAHVKALV